MPSEDQASLQDRLRAMPAERWQAINDLLDAVLEQPPGERAAFLAAETGDDADLRAEVEALLAAHDEAGTFLDTPAEAILPLPEEPSFEGRRVGAYRVLECIGQGGMGAVYLAEREDLPKRVALKLVRDGLAAPERVQRFLFERRVLARLEHPHIARLIDAGVTDEGTPFFAMEYVEGQPLDRYCDANGLSIDERLKLFQTVCGVVHYAHQNLVVHRDLKPSNILVAEDGTVKLLDFGIAKLLEDDESEAAPLTRTGMHILTPEYAAPEQLLGEPVTTATDVYALGVLLYELLTGQRPQQRAKSGDTTVPATRPSTAVGKTGAQQDAITAARSTTAEKLRRRLRGDLDTICLKALRPEPARRYQSAEQFLEDIRRHLAGLPVSARRDTVGYRVGKFVQRHRVSVAAAVLVLFTLLAGVVLTTRQARIAEAERARAERVAAVLPELFWNLEPGELQNTAVTPEAMLDRGLAQIEERLAEEPEIQARILTLATDVYMRLGVNAKAEQAARRALALGQQHYGTEHAQVAASMAMLAQALDKQAKYDEAGPLHEDALALRRRLLGSQHPDVATSLHNYAMFHDQQGRYDEAESLYREALAIRQAAPEDVARDLAYTQSNLAVMLFYKGIYAEAESLATEALALRRLRLGSDHPDIAQSLNILAHLAETRGDLDAAERYHRESIDLNRNLLGDDHLYVGYTLSSLGLLLKQLNNLDEAEALLREALAIFRTTHGEQHPDIAYGLHNLAFVRAAKGAHEEALAGYRDALALERATLGEAHPTTASTLHEMGRLILETDPAEAEPLLREAFTIRRDALSADHELTGGSASLLGACLARLHRPDEAEPLLVQGFETLTNALGADHETTQAALERLLDFYDATGAGQQATAYRARQSSGDGPAAGLQAP